MTAVPMVQAFRRWSTDHRDDPALTVGNEQRTFGQLDERSDRVADALERLGVEQGSYVTVALPNSVGFIESVLAILKLGAVVQPVSSRLPLAERRGIVELAGSSVVIGAEAEDHPGRACVRDLDDLDLTTRPTERSVRVSEPWRATTSGGSTGRPKLIVGVPPAMVDDEIQDYLLPRGSVTLIPGPLYHGGPFLVGITSLFYGNHLILQERFDAEKVLDLIESYRVAYVLLVPTMMHRIWRLRPAERATDVSSLRTVLHLASACPPWLKEAWIGWLGPDRVYELFGASDAPNRTIISGNEWLAHRGSVGRTKVGEFKITDADGMELPPGETGEIWLRPPPGEPERSYVVGAEPRIVDGWTSVGDVGWIDADGYLFVADRRADMIVTGGENVYPAEVEAALDQHPGVRSSAVIGLPDEDLGRRVHAVVEVDDGVGEDALRAFMREQLASYKIPRSFDLVDHAVRDDAGKVRKSSLIRHD